MGKRPKVHKAHVDVKGVWSGNWQKGKLAEGLEAEAEGEGETGAQKDQMK